MPLLSNGLSNAAFVIPDCVCFFISARFSNAPIISLSLIPVATAAFASVFIIGMISPSPIPVLIRERAVSVRVSKENGVLVLNWFKTSEKSFSFFFTPQQITKHK